MTQEKNRAGICPGILGAKGGEQRDGDERIQSAATLFKSLLYLEPRQVPPLDGQLATLPSPPEIALPIWLKDYVKPKPAEDASEGKPIVPEPSSIGVDPSWIFDFLVPGDSTRPSAPFKNSMIPERVLLAVSAIIVASLVIFTSPTGSGLNIVGLISIVLMNLVLWVYRYRSEPAVADFLILQLKLKTVNEAISATERNIKAAGREKAKLQEQTDASRARLEREQQVVEAKERGEFDASQRALQSVLSSISTRRRALQQQEANELRKIRNEVGAKVAALNQQLGTLTQAEANELANALRNQQQQYTNAYLRRFSIDEANIPGLGVVLKSRLRAAGFHTAADINFYRVQSVEGIGTNRASALAAWQQTIGLKARATMSQSLSQNEQATIRAKYQSQRRTLEGERDRLQQRQSNEETAVRQRYALEFQRLDNEEQAAQAKTQREIDELRERYRQQCRSLQESISKLEKDTEGELRKIDGRINEARKKLFNLHWEKQTARRQLKAFEGIRFARYVVQVFLGSRTA